MAEQNTENFIELVKINNILWDLTNPNYKNVKMKAVVWKKISEEFGLSIDLCKKKWKGLRDTCSRDISKKPKSGQAAEETDCGWKYRDQMVFMRDHMKPRSTKSNVNLTAENQESQTTEIFSQLNEDSFLDHQTQKFLEEPSPTISSSAKKRKSQESMETTFLSTLKSVQMFLNKPARVPVPAPDPNSDEGELFCRSLVKKIKRFSTTKKNEAKVEVLRYLNNIEETVCDDD